MDDSDRSRDDDSVAADGSAGEADTDGAVDEGSETAASDDGAPETGDSEADGDASDDPAAPDSAPDDGPEPDDAAAEPDAARAAAEESDATDADTPGSDEAAAAAGADDATAASLRYDTETAGDGGTPTTAAETPTADAATAVDDEPFEGIEGPETDEEMPLAAHIEEMMRRLAVVFLIGGLATLVVVTESTELINYFWSYHIPAPLENRPRLYGPLELPLTRLKVAGLAGVVVGLPAFVYETYRFMRPGLYQTERRYYLAAVPTSLILGGIGIAFAHFLVLPAIFSYFTTYTSDAATIAFGLAETFNLIVIMLSFMAIVFQIPLFIMLAIMMNLVTRQWLEAKRLIFWGSFLGIAFLFSPDPTGMAPIIVTLTMIALFEGTLAILRWTGN
ncbi:Sec-independent periplasmic protein translocase [Halorubrum coriense DSM 10284]|uniref:Sec-independent protein translocase protein TatC n=1 Tax=Halorubrum coriense DSM 10284 TaxID=1227466 RepID=M0EE43_9EURY|nr:twin-arginine translocase subunit TatC [Halorubrum coriense]ELZ45333.1 Sec-independent periplasmic protein translocase [Halorubrum coriense DSM 10284]